MGGVARLNGLGGLGGRMLDWGFLFMLESWQDCGG